MKKVIVLSLGGSVIIPEKVDKKFLGKFKEILRKNYNEYKFVIVCGGGSVARKYISILQSEHKNNKEISLAGIRATRMNALILMQDFGKEANDHLPLNMEEVKNNLNKNKVVICGALRFTEKATSDSTAVKLAHFLKTEFINITNVPGLYDKNPTKNKNAKLIKKISWKDFERIAKKIHFKPGQHFVLDQNASSMIKNYKIKTYIIGKDLNDLTKILKNKPFEGTTIEN